LDFKITYKYGIGFPAYPHQVKGWSDSDWASDEDSRKSISGYVFTLGGGPISWQCHCQPTISLCYVTEFF